MVMGDRAAQQPQPRRGKASAAQTRAAEHALLGLLAAPDVPSPGGHGCDLSRQFADGVLADVVRLEPGMLYHHLKSMAKRGLIETTIERQASRPDRQMHAITDAGRTSLDAWLIEPGRATREVRLEFLLKLYLVQAQDAAMARQLIAAQREVIEQLIASMEQQRDALPTGDADDTFRRQVLSLRIVQNRAALTWLDSL
jgi:DNA-binding PadR family transcriptional regulator